MSLRRFRTHLRLTKKSIFHYHYQNNTLYVYGGFSTNLTSCNSKVFSVNISLNSSPWQIVKQIDNQCVFYKSRISDILIYTTKFVDGLSCDKGNMDFLLEEGQKRMFAKNKVPCP